MTVDTLNEVDIFSTLSSDEVSRIYHLMENRSVPEGEVLFREGDPGNLMYIVLSGTVAITISVSEGEEVEVSRIGEGNFFGEMSIFEKDVRSATCRAVDECTIAVPGRGGAPHSHGERAKHGHQSDDTNAEYRHHPIAEHGRLPGGYGKMG